MKLLVLSFLLALSFNCSAQHIGEMWTGTALILGDWSTTRNMTQRYDEGFVEKGPIASKIIGSRPSTREVDLYFITRLALHYAVYKSDLSDSNKSIYYYFTIADHGSAIVNNLSIGLKIKF